MSRVTAISAQLSASSSACHGLLIITVDNAAITYKAQRDKMPETEAGERGQLPTCRCVSVMPLPMQKIHEGVS